MGEREVVTILSFGNLPEGTWVTKTKSEIKALLQNTDPFYIEGTGQTYQNAATKIEQAVTALEEHAPKIAEVWQGPDASRARHALEMLHASGNELSTKLSMMGGALQTYAAHLRETQGKVDEEVTVPAAGSMTSSEEELVREGLENTKAQRALYELNQKIVSIYDIEVPHSVSYELPAVSLPAAPVDTQDPKYPTGSGTQGPTFRTPLSEISGGSNGGGSGGFGTTNTGGGSTGSLPGGSNPGGSDPGGSNPGGTHPGGSDPDTPGSNNPENPQNPDAPVDPAPDAPTTEDPGQAQNPVTGTGDDDTVPPVIGTDDKTTIDGPNGTNPRQTDMASYQPTTATIASPATPPTTTISPSYGYAPAPVGGSPGTPAVIGSPGIGTGQTALTSSGSRGAGGTSAGAPFLPFMGGGAGGEHGDLERSTYMPEDKSAWTVGCETTDPVIG
ncbi:hypothetical protein [Nonomuraea sp. KM90]|uniref:hypothetical protein n=1 Tax=Nonomuraea sp. KM90 TaxID=3457428 RepID=UPI003FCE14C6